jgi:hypothetical protein
VLDLIADHVEIGRRALRREDAQCSDAVARGRNVAPCVVIVGIEAIPAAGLDRIAYRVTHPVGHDQHVASVLVQLFVGLEDERVRARIP